MIIVIMLFLKFSICHLVLLGSVTGTPTGVARKDLKDPCQDVYRDCLDLYLDGCQKDGVYRIDPNQSGQMIKAYCDMTYNGGGWTVIQRRVDASVYFLRDWGEYVAGFGDLSANMWLGLDNINNLANGTDLTELYIYMESFENESRFAKFSNFYIDDISQRFKLHVSGYYGTAGDSLTRHNNRRFTTFDFNNGVLSSNCANMYSGAWWYDSCHSSNLNGLYLSGSHSSYANGINYFAWKGYHYSLKTTIMKVRRHSELVAPSYVSKEES